MRVIQGLGVGLWRENGRGLLLRMRGGGGSFIVGLEGGVGMRDRVYGRESD